MSDLSFLDFQADFSSAGMVNAYDELPLWSAMFGLLLLDEVPLESASQVLDVGCGTGFPLIELAERLGTAARVHGIDPWGAALRRAADKIAARGVTNVILNEGTASSMPFAAGAFDLIVSNLGLNNFDDRVAAIGECRRVARTGARLALTTNLSGHMREFYAVYEAVLTSMADETALRRLAEHVDHRGTAAGVKELLENGGFAVERIVQREATMRFGSGTALLDHYFIKLGFMEGWKRIVPGSERQVFARLRDSLDRLARGAGELRLTIPMAYIEAIAR